MRCCVAWEPVGKCFDPISFECIDFHGLSQIIESLTHESLAEREAEICNLPWTQTDEDNALAKCRLGLRAWRAKKTMLCLHALTDEDGHPLENEDESGRRLSEYWSTIFQAHVEGSSTITLRPSCDTSRKLVTTRVGKSTETKLNELMATKKGIRSWSRWG